MGKTNERVSVIIVGYNHKPYLADCVRAARNSAPGARLILIDNASTDGTDVFVRAELKPDRFIASEKNLGFAGGNNLGIDIVLKDGDGFVYLLNPDTEAQPGFLEKALDVMRSDPKIGIVQSLLVLSPETDKINSWGNNIHFLGFGYAGGDSTSLAQARSAGKLEIRDIAYASGAGMLVRTSMIREIGGLDETLFAYHEDLEYSWRARLAGWRVMLAPDSIVHHKYEFSRSIAKWYWMERNRFLVMAWCYRLPTLICLVPVLILLEFVLWLFALKSGWWREKARAYAYVLAPSRWGRILRDRRRVQALRTVSDREATKLFTGKILFQRMSSPIVDVGNTVLDVFWRVLHFVMFW